MNTIHHLDMANLFVGDDDPTKSQFLVMKNVKVPSLEEKTKEHTGSGAAMSVEIGMRVVNALSMPFQLEGINPDVMTRFMPGPGASRIRYTVRANIRNVRDHTDIPLKAIVEGRMTKAEMSEFDRDKGTDSSYEIKEVFFYSLHLGTEEKYYFDYFSGPAGVRIGGIPVFQNAARNLGLA